MKLLLEHQETDVNSKDDVGETPLHWAAENGHEATVKLRLDWGADVNSQDIYGHTPPLRLTRGNEAIEWLLFNRGTQNYIISLMKSDEMELDEI